MCRNFRAHVFTHPLEQCVLILIYLYSVLSLKIIILVRFVLYLVYIIIVKLLSYLLVVI